jgi:protein-tyrosine kinase
MREVDEALARAFAKREQSDPRTKVPPAPHWPVRAHNTAFPPIQSLDKEAQSVELHWPAVVLTLEREWGDRFEKLARLMRTVQERQGFKAFLFTSCHRAEGRSTLVLTLARALAREPGNTLVVDADLTGPMIARLLALRPEVGLDDVVESGRALSDALIDARDEHLGILPMR